MTASYIYFLPKFGKNHNLLDIPVVRLIINDWQLSGLLTATEGSPTGFSFGFQNDSSNISQRWTGNPDYGPRPILRGLAIAQQPGDGLHGLQHFGDYGAAWRASPSQRGVGVGFQLLEQPDHVLVQHPNHHDEEHHVQQRQQPPVPSAPAGDLQHVQPSRLHRLCTREPRSTARRTSPWLTCPPALVSPANANGGRFGFGAKTGGRQPAHDVQLAMKIYF